MLLYSISNAFIPLTSFIVLLVLTRYLAPYDFGLIGMFLVVFGVAKATVGINAHGAIGREFFEKDRVDFPGYITNALWLVLSSGLLLWLIAALFSPVLEKYTSLSLLWISIIVIGSIFYSKTQIISTLWVVMERPFIYSLYQVGISIGSMLLILWLVVDMGLDWRGRVLGQMLVIGVAGSIAVLCLRKENLLKPTFNIGQIRHAWNFGWPLIPHALGLWVITATDHVLIKNMVSMEELGLYSVGVRFGMLIMLLQDAFNRAWVPICFKWLKQNDIGLEKRIVRITYFYIVCILIISILFGLLAPKAISYFIDPKYNQAGQFIIWISLGYAFNGMYKMFACYFYYSLNTAMLAKITLMASLINVGLSYALILFWGSIGAAVGTMFTFLVMFIATFLLSTRIYPMPWNFFRQRFGGSR